MCLTYLTTVLLVLRSSRCTFRSLTTRQETWGSCGIMVATKTSTGLSSGLILEILGFAEFFKGLHNTVGDGDKDMCNACGKEEEEYVLKQRRQDQRGDIYRGYLYLLQSTLKQHESGAYNHKVNNEAKVKRGQKSINQWLKHTVVGRIKPQARSIRNQKIGTIQSMRQIQSRSRHKLIWTLLVQV
ncbi:hypothetical protein EDB87DRAFT_1583126 [Lactarius vividus]|nr:hypothetical protein EDB87DRAFT_1583126 [Lactarius vividus]